MFMMRLRTILNGYRLEICVGTDKKTLNKCGYRSVIFWVQGKEWVPSFFNMFLGYFYAPDAPDESVLGMCTNANNSLLVTGDTQGFIKVWDIMTHCVRPSEDGVRLIHHKNMLYRSS